MIGLRIYQPGWVYVLSHRHYGGLLKIGFSDRVPEARVKEMHRETGTPIGFINEYSCLTPDAHLLEMAVHKKLAPSRDTPGKEFFSVSIKEAADAIRHAAKERGIKILDEFDPHHTFHSYSNFTHRKEFVEIIQKKIRVYGEDSFEKNLHEITCLFYYKKFRRLRIDKVFLINQFRLLLAEKQDWLFSLKGIKIKKDHFDKYWKTEMGFLEYIIRDMDAFVNSFGDNKVSFGQIFYFYISYSNEIRNDKLWSVMNDPNLSENLIRKNFNLLVDDNLKTEYWECIWCNLIKDWVSYNAVFSSR